jgi:hypothetical protein
LYRGVTGKRYPCIEDSIENLKIMRSMRRPERLNSLFLLGSFLIFLSLVCGLLLIRYSLHNQTSFLAFSTLIYLVLSVGGIIIQYATKPFEIQYLYSTAIRYLNAEYAKKEKKTKLFQEFLSSLLIFALIIVFVFAILWFLHITHIYGAWIVSILCVYITFKSFKGKGNLILHIIYVPVLVMHLIWGSYYLAAVIVATTKEFISIVTSLHNTYAFRGKNF